MACLATWEKVGAAFGNTCTNKCLRDPKVRISFEDGSDDYLRAVQMGNNLAVYALNEGGYGGDLLKATIKQTKAPEVLMRPQSMEHVNLSQGQHSQCKVCCRGWFPSDDKQYPHGCLS